MSAPPVPSLLRGFSAPVKLVMETSTEELLLLLRTDANSFNRWQAAQRLANAGLVAATEAVRAGTATAFDPGFIDALADVAENEALEPAFRAQVLQLPAESDIAREMGHDIDPDAIATAPERFSRRDCRPRRRPARRRRAPGRGRVALLPRRGVGGPACARQRRLRPHHRQPRPRGGGRRRHPRFPTPPTT